MPILGGALVRLEPATTDHVTALAAIRRSPQVHDFWRGGDDLVAAVNEDLQEPGSTPYVIECDGRVVGWIQWSAEDDPDYRYASIDIYLDPAVHGRGLGTDAVRTMARHLIDDHGHHRLEIDPAADNVAAIRCYSKVGFRPVGIRRNSERGNDGSWHDGLLMDLLADELTPAGHQTAVSTGSGCCALHDGNDADDGGDRAADHRQGQHDADEQSPVDRAAVEVEREDPPDPRRSKESDR